MIRLLDSCIRLLADQGMNKLLIDAVRGGDEGFQSMGRCLSICAAKKLTDPNQAFKNGQDTETFGGMSKSQSFDSFGRRPKSHRHVNPLK